jgi:hypothetical protein
MGEYLDQDCHFESVQDAECLHSLEINGAVGLLSDGLLKGCMILRATHGRFEVVLMGGLLWW